MLIVFTPSRPRIAPFFVAHEVLARDSWFTIKTGADPSRAGGDTDAVVELDGQVTPLTRPWPCQFIRAGDLSSLTLGASYGITFA